MEYHKVIIVGGGPAGASCASELVKAGVDCTVLDYQEFPRLKLCAGWITPQVIKDVGKPPGMKVFDRIIVDVKGKVRKARTRQYSVRRIEFDEWLLKKSNVQVIKHKVNDIKRNDKGYVIDGKFLCEYIVGAGGTFCPVYRALFEKGSPRDERNMVIALEEEFAYDYKDPNCYLWFFKNNLPGYSWYVPKNGYVNVGVGAMKSKLTGTIQEQWDYLILELDRLGLIKNHVFKPKGYFYYVHKGHIKWYKDKAFIIGDSLGLATHDMGEGIGPAIRSGKLAARSIIDKKVHKLRISKLSLWELWKMWLSWITRTG